MPGANIRIYVGGDVETLMLIACPSRALRMQEEILSRKTKQYLCSGLLERLLLPLNPYGLT